MYVQEVTRARRHYRLCRPRHTDSLQVQVVNKLEGVKGVAPQSCTRWVVDGVNGVVIAFFSRSRQSVALGDLYCLEHRVLWFILRWIIIVEGEEMRRDRRWRLWNFELGKLRLR